MLTFSCLQLYTEKNKSDLYFKRVIDNFYRWREEINVTFKF